jgi:hypothetical protein
MSNVHYMLNALMEILTDLSDVHSKCHPCVRNEMFNKTNYLELTRVPSGPKTYLKIPTLCVSSFPLSLRKPQISIKASVLRKDILFYQARISKKKDLLFTLNDKVKFRQSKGNLSTTLVSKVVNIKRHFFNRYEINHRQYLSICTLSMYLTRHNSYFYTTGLS